MGQKDMLIGFSTFLIYKVLKPPVSLPNAFACFSTFLIYKVLKPIPSTIDELKGFSTFLIYKVLKPQINEIISEPNILTYA